MIPHANVLACLANVVVLLVAFVVSIQAAAGEPLRRDLWRRLRGDNGVGRLARCDAPLPWTQADVAWEIALPGRGHGSPILYGNSIFLMSADPDSAERHLLAIDLKSGAEQWHHAFPSQPHHLHVRSSYASSTPCVDERAVYFAWATPDSLTLAAFDHAGAELWKKDLGPYTCQHGFGASPVLVGTTLVLFNSQDAEELLPGVPPGNSSVMAFDSATGEQKWATHRISTRVCYGSPVYFKDPVAGDALLFSSTGDGLFALSLETGTPLWSSKVFDKRCVSSPIIVGDMAIATEGSGGGGNTLYGVALSGNHEVQLKVNRSAPYVPTPVAKDDLLFLWGDTGIVSCLKLPGGEVLWSKRIGGNVSSSPVVAGDKLIGIAEDGTVTVLSASAEFAELGSVKLEDLCRATPALGEHFVVLRTASRLICVGRP